ncbi:IS1/IS1595 family N-terminal zinc-binding domain-containing protein [Scytonema sp. PRP1]|uniref:IS1/IS1595 family N-terminal zinc-binding domain-containing protein n=1 Tax=Scytonema sp. PRP1 TaxID=3120513 RepID=UPI003FA72C81
MPIAIITSTAPHIRKNGRKRGKQNYICVNCIDLSCNGQTHAKPSHFLRFTL